MCTEDFCVPLAVFATHSVHTVSVLVLAGKYAQYGDVRSEMWVAVV